MTSDRLRALTAKAATHGRVAVVLGTRPEIIKLAEIVSLLGSRALVIHTGQHWDHAMSGTFMSSLGLPQPAISLSVGGGERASQIAQTITGVSEVLARHDVAAVVVQGDTNTVLGGAIAANAGNVPLVHVEAGLRSFDRTMPEEHNRVLTDHLADLCLAPTAHSRELLLSEGISRDRIVVTGNTVVAAVTRALAQGAGKAQNLLDGLGLTAGEFILATIHRPENTDDREQFAAILNSLVALTATCPVLLPLHPRSRRRAEEMVLSPHLEKLTVIDPLGYEEFVSLSARAAFTISDSGGVQEEASVWKRPVLVVRRSTERPEGLGTFAQLVRAGDPLVDAANDLYRRRAELSRTLSHAPSPYGDGDAAKLSVNAILALINGTVENAHAFET